MTTPVDIANKQLKLHGQDCVCDGCEVARALVSGTGNPARKNKELLETKAALAGQEQLNHVLIQDKTMLEVAVSNARADLVIKEAEVTNLTARLVETNNKLLKMDKEFPEESKKNLELYRRLAEEWKRKALMLEKELSMHDPAARWDNPLYDPN